MPRIVYQKGGKLVSYGQPPVIPNAANSSSLTIEGSASQTFTPNSVPFAGVDGKLTQDNTGLNFVNGYMGVGTNNPSVASGLSLNGGRAILEAQLNGLTIHVGTTQAGAFDTTKHFNVYNGYNTPFYLDIYTTGTGPYVHHYATPGLVANDFVDDVAAAAGNIAVGEQYHTSGTLKIRLA